MLPFENFNEQEHKFLCCLCQVNGRDPWSKGIQLFVADPSEQEFKQLIKDLKSQAADDSDTMKRILG
ncbi:MAG: hypothetical protein Q8938_20210, partial [Bacteroidota bacterium]|nr:hypothetical protein [Bacteroidota bacterium]